MAYKISAALPRGKRVFGNAGECGELARGRISQGLTGSPEAQTAFDSIGVNGSCGHADILSDSPSNPDRFIIVALADHISDNGAMNDLELLDRMKERTGTWAELARQLHVTAGVRLDHEAIYKWRKRAQIAHSWRPWVLIFARKLELPVSIDVTLPRPRRWPAKSRSRTVERAAESA